MIKRYSETSYYYGDTEEAADGEYMKAAEVLGFLRQIEDTLPDYTDGTYDNDQICDVSWVKTRLQEELE